MNKEKPRLTPDEILAIQLALSQMTEDLIAVGSDPTIPLTPEARRMNKEMLASAKSAHAKIATASGQMIELDPYKEGDENEFMTKQS